MGLTQKILLFTSLIVVALVATTLAYTTLEANRLANQSMDEALAETRGVWEAYQADRYSKLKQGLRVLANDPYFKALVELGDAATLADTLQERGQDLAADFFIATDPDGQVVARSDRPGAVGEDLSGDPLIEGPLDGEESSATVWRQGARLFHAVSVPMYTGLDLVGVLVAGYAIDERVTSQLRRLTRCDVAFTARDADGRPRVMVSSLGSKQSALTEALRRSELPPPDRKSAPFLLDLAGDAHVSVRLPLENASGAVLGSVVALRSRAAEMAAFNRFRNSLVLVSLIVMTAALALAYLGAARVTGPLRTLVDLVERARDGSYVGSVAVATRDEIGALARSFSRLLADLREKEQMINFLREGMTQLKQRPIETMALLTGAPDVDSAVTVASAPTLDGSAQTKPVVTRLEPGVLFAGRYEIRSLLGSGGMGLVYRAQDRQLEEDVALKVLRPEALRDDETLLQRFKQEIRLARRITHRNVLRTHDFDEAEGVAYISMEYLEGVTLKDLVRSRGALPEAVGLRIAKQMCHGLEAAHQVNVIHRDIKPQNMLILPETGELKIMDFGIARMSEVKAEAGLTVDGVVMGTPDYIPPEQAQGKPADFRSDIYSLGVVLFEIFSGRVPFSGDTVMATIIDHIQTPPPAPRSFNAQLAPDLERIILRCLHKDPGGRYQVVGDLLEALSAVSTHAEAG